MSYITRNLHQTCTMWAPTGQDAFGARTFARSTMACRWEDRLVYGQDKSGNQIVGRAVVYTKYPVPIGGYLFLGESSQPNPGDEPGALTIKDARQIPNLRATEKQYQAIVG